MSNVVGQLPTRRRIIRAPVNPYDKSTIVSVFPKELDEKKPTIIPGRFILPPGSAKVPSLLTVGPSSWWREVDEDQPLLEIPVSSIIIAESFVKDYCNGILGFNSEAAMPGLGYLPGEIGLDELKSKYKTFLDGLIAKQNAWYRTLVKMADSLWARSNGNPLAVSDDMRMAARELGQSDVKDWMKDFQMTGMTRCAACGALKNPEYPVCSSCRAIDSSHPSAKDLKFAV